MIIPEIVISSFLGTIIALGLASLPVAVYVKRKIKKFNPLGI